jgi:lysyl-tRNA synthetase class 2
MSSLQEIIDSRKKKLELLKAKGHDPYPASSLREYSNEETLKAFNKLSKKAKITLAGRVMSLRPHGGLLFFNVFDGTANFQCLVKEDVVGKDSFSLFSQCVDMGDFVEASGKLFVTKRGEKTLEVKGWRILTKSLLPLPEKWHGLTDTEERFRKRYLDTLSSDEVRQRFVTRTKVVNEIRSLLNDDGFMEVETPMLQPQAGGATAVPFVTHHQALDIDLFLRIAPELYLKMLLVGGFNKVYEIGRNFRNEGIDVTHNPEFTMLEYYRAYSDSQNEMKFVESLIKKITKAVVGKNKFEYSGKNIDLSKKFEVISYSDLFSKYTEIKNLQSIDLEGVKKVAEKASIKISPADSREKIIDSIYKKLCRPNLINPTFVTEYPASMLPLSKRLKTNTELADAFQLIMGGLEIVKAFTELNDPLDQRERFKKEERFKEMGDVEAQSTDEAFLEALDHGMPPAGGVGIGIDRLVMLLTNSHNIREVIFFPTLRPR